MSFKSVTITKKANVYFDGKVTSRAITFEDGSSKTLGIMLPGEYTFNTEAPELMEITAGELKYRIKDSDKWISIKGGESFDVPGSSSFDLVIEQVTDYICTFK